MSEMKMSDVFELPLELRNDLVHFSKSDTCYFKVESVKSRDEELQVTYCIHQAINNHDSLVEEVERLRGDNQRLTAIATKHATRADELYGTLETVLLVLEGKTEFHPDEISIESVRSVLDKSRIEAEGE